jgi:hypothetical protein
VPDKQAAESFQGIDNFAPDDGFGRDARYHHDSFFMPAASRFLAWRAQLLHAEFD